MKGEQRLVGSCPLCGKRSVLRLNGTMSSHSPPDEGKLVVCAGTGKPAVDVTRGKEPAQPKPLERAPSVDVTPLQQVLSHFIASDLAKAEKEGLLSFKPENLQAIADRIAVNLAEGTDERTGRRRRDRLREALWNALRWKPGKNRRRDDAKPDE